MSLCLPTHPLTLIVSIRAVRPSTDWQPTTTAVVYVVFYYKACEHHSRHACDAVQPVVIDDPYDEADADAVYSPTSASTSDSVCSYAGDQQLLPVLASPRLTETEASC